MQTENSFRLSTDSVLLSAFARAERAKSCLDLGSGAGVLCVLLAAKNERLTLCGVEIQQEYAELSRRNLAENGMDGRSRIIQGDIKDIRQLLPAESFELVVSNPPYFPQNSGFSAPTAHRAAAREEKLCTLEDICAAAKWSLKWGGCLAMVHRPERLSEIFCAMTAAGIEPKRLRMVCHGWQKAPSLVLVEGKRGAAAGLLIEPPLVLTDENGADSEEIQKIYRRGVYAPRQQERL